MNDGVTFHQNLAAKWEQKYRKRSFASRREIVRECLRGTNLKGSAWLDAGCGSGTLARWLAEQGCEVQAVDAAAEMLRVAQQVTAHAFCPLPITYQQVATIEALPFAADSFDGVLCSSVLEYVTNPKACLRELGRVLRPDGILLVSVPSARSLFRRLLHAGHACTTIFGHPWPGYISISRHQYSVSQFQDLLQAQSLVMETFVCFGTRIARKFPRNELLGSLLMFRARKRGTIENEAIV